MFFSHSRVFETGRRGDQINTDRRGLVRAACSLKDWGNASSRVTSARGGPSKTEDGDRMGLRAREVWRMES